MQEECPVKKLYILILAASFLIVFTALQANHARAEVKDQIISHMNALQKNIIALPEMNPKLAASSNPYDYVKDNKEYQNIVALGNAAIPALTELLNDTPENGLTEYIYAIALEQISKTDLKAETGWSTAKQFAKKWNVHLSQIPEKVSQIVNSDDSNAEKIQRLNKLGTPAIPFILKSIDAGHSNLVPSLDYLTGGEAGNNYKSWYDKNSDTVEKIRSFVIDKQK